MELDINEFKRKIFQISTKDEFNELSLQLFYHQAAKNPIYSRFIQLLGKSPRDCKKLDDIPFLPIELFKSQRLITTGLEPEMEFTSSGTTSAQTSTHFVADLELYKSSFTACFENFYGKISDYSILALLPSYLERTGSSLVFMVDHLIAASNSEDSGFFLNNLEELHSTILKLKSQRKKVLVIGVSFALLELAEKFPGDYSGIAFMETGGMKGRRKELTREELHHALATSFGVKHIHSEYGMTELLSQAYSSGKGMFTCPQWMKVLIRDTDDPLSRSMPGKAGGIDIIDLANINSCAFVSTQDLGRKNENDEFEVIGRYDQSDIRGCNLLV